jgi:hypothetical protein
MMALGFAMVATATAGPVIHADGMGTVRYRPVATSAIPAPSAGTATRQPGFYDSLAQREERCAGTSSDR